MYQKSIWPCFRQMDQLIDMNRKVCSIFIFLIYVKPEADLAITVRKFNHQKDMSEFCRRRVAPSVFLGKQVMGASSHVMHFSQLEVPYSCTLNVRTESGNNIILVIQLLSEAGLVDACARNSDQLMIYEFGETFGGYWGHLPDMLMRKTTRNYTRFYTLKTTEPTTPTTTRSTEDYETDGPNQILTHSTPEATDRAQDFITMEVPLVNVSGNFQLGPPPPARDAEEMFDFIYDVTPRNGVEYETSVLPLLQFSIKKQEVGPNSYGSERRYDLDYAVNGFTFDSRLLFSTANKRMSTRKRKWSSSRRLNFRKNSFHKLFRSRSTSYFVKNRSFTKTVASTSSTLNSSTWQIEDLMKSFDLTTMRSTVSDNITIRNILNKIFNIDHNSSVYLAPNLFIYDKNHLNYSNETYVKSDTFTNLNNTKNMHSILLSKDAHKMDNLSCEPSLVKDKKLDNFMHTNTPRVTLHADSKEEFQSTKNNEINKVNKSDIVSVKVNSIDLDHSSKTLRYKSNNTLQTGTLVDRESWENIVQAAPMMAVVLNKSEISNKSRRGTDKFTIHGKSNKKKRHIHALEIEGSRPRNLTTHHTVTAAIETQYQLSGLQDLAELVELQDDEISGRLALRYLRNYVGSALFNICDFQEPKSRQVYLFNASRIVIAVNNFTLEGMTLVLTPAQSLLGSMSLCDTGHLECQIIGSRVCIDSINACDAVPNCGSHDIYDEDRLKCGVTKGLQHNVYLAAFTFLALILTTLCTVHYWLKRCVPRVSEAFFIYTDATENTLFLDTIMRSPNDVDISSYKYTSSGNFYDTDILYEDGFKEADLNENFCRRIIRKCCALLCKRKCEEHPDHINNEVFSSAPLDLSNNLSFTKYELHRFAFTTSREEAIQTGESLEMQSQTYNKGKKDDYSCNIIEDQLIKNKEVTDLRTHDKYAEELKLIKFTNKETRSSSQCDALSIDQRKIKMARRNALVVDDEKEIKSTVYECDPNTNINSENIRVKVEVYPEKPKKDIRTTKHLRFDEELTVIPSIESGGEITIDTMDTGRSVVLGTGSQSNQDLDLITQFDSQVSDGRDFMRFWGTSKSKKVKKKKEKHLSARYK